MKGTQQHTKGRLIYAYERAYASKYAKSHAFCFFLGGGGVGVAGFGVKRL